jgi:Flp pilus assembly protein TadD
LEPDIGAGIQEAKAFRSEPHWSLENASRVCKENDAVAEYQSALNLGEDRASAHYGIGKILFGKSDLGGALAELQRALQLNPDSGQYHEALCLAQERKGLAQEAMVECRAAYLLDPKNAEIRANFERLLQKEKK